MDLKKVLVLFGGASSEHEVSRRSAYYILNSIPKDRFGIVTIGIRKDGCWLLYEGDFEKIPGGEWEEDPSCRRAFLSPDPSVHGIVVEEENGIRYEKIDVIFPVLHGKNGEDGTIQGLFELSKIPYVGCNTLASAACMDKAVTHTLLSAVNIEQAHYLWFFSYRYLEDPEGARKIEAKVSARFNFPVFVKPANAGSSVGVSRVQRIEDFRAAVEKAAREDGKIVVEEGVLGQEVECAVLGNRKPLASTVGEIGATAEFYDYDDKYVSGTSQLYIPARLSSEKIEEIRAIACRAYWHLGCSGLARVDFFVKENGQVILNEVNTLPGFTSISMYPKLWEACGKTGEELVCDLIDYAFEVK